jgi:DNA replication protein DnaC
VVDLSPISRVETTMPKLFISELSQLSFLHNHEHLLLLGGTDEGKTQLAIGLGRRICSAGHSVLFISVSFFFEESLASRSSGRYLAWVKSCTSKDVLILDDFALRKYTHDEASVLIDVLEERQSKGVLIVTSQVNPDGWKSLFQDPVIAEAIVDRMTQPAQTVILSGGSYRSKSGIKNMEKLVTKGQKSSGTNCRQEHLRRSRSGGPLRCKTGGRAKTSN